MRTVILILALSFAGDVAAVAAADGYTLYLIRHAEKQADGGRDPALTETGQRRAQWLATWFQDKHIEDVWSSDFKRTRETAEPLASRLSIGIKIYDPRDQATLLSQLSALQHNAVIIGHSNTIPALARLLCNCAIADMHETEHDRVIVITVAGGMTRVETLKQTQ